VTGQDARKQVQQGAKIDAQIEAEEQAELERKGKA